MRLLLKYQVWLLVLLPALSRIPQITHPHYIHTRRYSGIRVQLTACNPR